MFSPPKKKGTKSQNISTVPLKNNFLKKRIKKKKNINLTEFHESKGWFPKIKKTKRKFN
jgi:hypothetical protein